MRIIILLLLVLICAPTTADAVQSDNRVRMAILPFQPLDQPTTEAAREVARQVTEGLRHRLSMDPLIEMVSDEDLSRLPPGADNAIAARQLNADIVVGGTTIMGFTSRSAEVLRISYQLFDQSTGANVWTQSFDQDYAEVESMLDGTAMVIRRAIPQRVFARRGLGGAVIRPLPIAPPTAAGAAQSENRVRIAILPFERFPDVIDRAEQTVARQVTEGLRHRLSMDPLIEMVSDEDLSRLPPGADNASAARQLNADIVVSGTTGITGWTSAWDTATSCPWLTGSSTDQPCGEVLRISYQLFDQSTGTNVRTQTFDQDYAEVESMLDGTARAIRTAISSYAPSRAELKPRQSKKTGDFFTAL